MHDKKWSFGFQVAGKPKDHNLPLAVFINPLSESSGRYVCGCCHRHCCGHLVHGHVPRSPLPDYPGSRCRQSRKRSQHAYYDHLRHPRYRLWSLRFIRCRRNQGFQGNQGIRQGSTSLLPSSIQYSSVSLSACFPVHRERFIYMPSVTGCAVGKTVDLKSGYSSIRKNGRE